MHYLYIISVASFAMHSPLMAGAVPSRPVQVQNRILRALVGSLSLDFLPPI